VISAGRWLISAVLIILPGSCIAAPPPPPPKPQPKAEAPKPAPFSIGAFKLNRAPQQGTIAIGVVPPGTVRLVKDGADIAIAPDGRFVIGFGRDHAPVASASLMLSFRRADLANLNR
jgi:hypothetical protein